jgi:flavin reductase
MYLHPRGDAPAGRRRRFAIASQAHFSHPRHMENKEELASSFKEAMRRVAATVNVISICVDGKPMGITATAVSVVSMDPPSLLVCVNQAASVHPQIENVVHFNVNVLHRDQAEVATIFADRKLEAQRFIRGWENDCVTPPRLRNAQASILCRRIDHHRFGTHSIFIGVVEEVEVREGCDPLVYLDGRYGSMGQ